MLLGSWSNPSVISSLRPKQLAARRHRASQRNLEKVAPSGNAGVVEEQLDITDLGSAANHCLHALRRTEIGNEGLDLTDSLGHLGCELIEAVSAAGDSEDRIPSSYQLFDEDVPQSS
jgi:hypothetical protein